MDKKMYPRMTEGELLYEQLRKEIVLLRIPPLTKLSEIQLAERFGTSRAPVRTALNRLSAEGLVDIRPQSGTFVTAISYEKAAHIRDIRQLLEPHAARLAAPKVGDEDVLYLRLQFGRLDGDMEADDRTMLVTEVDVAMHDMILDLCGNEELADIIRRFRPLAQRLSMANITRNQRQKSVEAEMRRICDALIARDGEAAYQEMYQHLAHINVHPPVSDPSQVMD